MTPQSLTKAIVAALMETKSNKELLSLLRDNSPKNANKIGGSLMGVNPALGLGLLHYSDALEMWTTAMRFSNEEARGGFAQQFNSYAHRSAQCLRQVPGVSISDNDYWKEWDGK